MSFSEQLIFGFFFCYLVGRLFSDKLPVTEVEKILFSPINGYIFIQLTFLSLVLLKLSPKYAQQLTLFPALSSIPFVFKDLRRLAILAKKNIKFILVYSALISFTVFSLIWPIIYAPSQELYWHSGADDLIRDVFGYSLKISSTGDYNKLPLIGHSLQYFSPAYWLLFFNDNNIKIILINYLLLLLFMFNGLYIWTKKTLNLSNKQSLFIAFISCNATFYTASYINYHGGTMMILAVIFYFLRLYFNPENNRAKLINLSFFSIFLIFSYHIAATLFYIATLPILKLTNSDRFSIYIKKLANISKLKIAFILFSIFTLSAAILFWYVTHNSFYFASTTIAPYDYPGYRAWELIRSPLVFAFYWGLIPSLVMGDGYPLLREIYSQPTIYYLIIFFSAYLTSLLFFSIKSINKKELAYVKFSCTFIAFLFPIFLLILDPYYTYKLLYITQPLFFVAIVHWLNNKSHFYTITNARFNLNFFVLPPILFLNIYWSIGATFSIFTRDYNNSTKIFEDLQSIPKNIACSSDFVIPSNELKIIFSAFFQQIEFCDNFKKSSTIPYLISSKLVKDINYRMPKDSIYDNESFSVKTKTNYLFISENFTSSEKNNFAEPVRQLYDRELKHNQPVSYELSFTIDNSNCYYDFIQLLIGPGDSRKHPDFNLFYKINNKVNPIKIFDQTLSYIPIKDNCSTFPVKIFTTDNEHLISLLPIEQRKLSAKILDLQLVKEKYTFDSLKLLNPTINVDQENLFAFSSGWSEFESNQFRWSQGQSEFIILNPTHNSLILELDLETGPSISDNFMNFFVLNSDGLPISDFTLKTGRHKTRIMLNNLLSNKPNRFLIQIDQHLSPIENDKRLLAFRLFSAALYVQ